MQKKLALWHTLILYGLFVLVTACGSNFPAEQATLTSTVPPGENIYVLNGYAPLNSTTTAQQIVALHPGGSNPATSISLPVGLTALDHQKMYTATPFNGRTTIAVINAQTGATLHTFTILGTYSTAQRGYDFAVLSSDGQWLALRALGQSSSQTTIVLVNTQAGKLARTIRLDGEFDLDAVSPDGSRIYMLEKLNNYAGHYHVRLYDVGANQLSPYILVDKSIPNDIMSGTALTRQMASDGSIAYTLYTDTMRNLAFVHILPLTGDYLGARCIDLPVGKNVNFLHFYTLALAPDGSTLYVANGALGVVSVISLNGNEVFYDKVAHANHFKPDTMSSTDTARMLYNGMALSSDLHTLYVVGSQGVWAVDTTNLSTKGHYLTQLSITGLALSADNRTLYTVDPSNGITLLNISTGQVQQTIQGVVHNPWGIAWVTH